jgi:arylsulfatase A-like enzyme
MSPRNPLPRLAFALLAFGGLGVHSVDAAPARPNVILIVADDLGYNDLSCYGATAVRTPNIDVLAARGIRLTDAHSTAAVCQPSRYSILTGEFPHRIVKKGAQQTYFRENQVTLPGLLKQAGYRTAAFGKWHNGFGRGAEPDFNQPNFVPAKPGAQAHTPLDLGFDLFFGTPRSHNEPPSVFVETAHDPQGKPYMRMHAAEPADPVRILPTEKDHTKRPATDHGHGYSQGAAAAHAARPEDRIDLITTQRALAYLAEQQANTPFFIYLPFCAPHVPISPAPEFQGKSEAGKYGDFIQQFDACVGQITEALRSRGLEENTLIIVTSDNGGLYLGPKEVRWVNNRPAHRPAAPFQGQKTDAWEGGHRVPLIAIWPAGGIPAGVTSDALFSGVDLMATVAAAVGLPLPAGAARDSIDQLPLLQKPKQTAPLRNELIAQTTKGWVLRHTEADGTKWAFLPKRGTGGETVVDRPDAGQWGQLYSNMGFNNSDITTDKLGRGRVSADAPANQLYNLTTDLTQTTNLSTTNPERTQALASRLTAILNDR